MPTLHTWRYPGAREISATEARAQRESLMARPAEGEILASSCRGAHLPNHQGTGTFRRLPSSLNRKGSGAPSPATRLREDMWAVALGRTAVHKTPTEAQGSGTKAPLPPEIWKSRYMRYRYQNTIGSRIAADFVTAVGGLVQTLVGSNPIMRLAVILQPLRNSSLCYSRAAHNRSCSTSCGFAPEVRLQSL
jgi:hypothetical protein